MRSARPATRRGGASQARPAVSARVRTGSSRVRPGGEARPTLREQLEAPIEPRRKASPGAVRRAAILGAVLAALLMVLTPALRSYLDQRAEISELKRTKAQNSAVVSSLEAQRARWNDPNFVKQQAEQRLGFTQGGKEAVIYVDRSGTVHSAPAAKSNAPTTVYRAHPWYGQVWSSISTKSNVER